MAHSSLHSGSAITPQREFQMSSYPNGVSLASIMFSLSLGTFLMALDTSIITVAIPKIATHFEALDQVGWYGSAYLITLTAFQPIAGKVYKLCEPKPSYLAFMVVFEVGSLICATAPLSEVFILGRALAGVGAAGLIQGALGIITYVSPLEKRPLYMAIVISVFGVTNSIGPTIGGILTDRVNWRWCFYINLPIGCIAFLLVLIFLSQRYIPTSAERTISLKSKLKALDPIGTALVLGAVACLCTALELGGHLKSWSSPQVVGLFVGFGIISIVFSFTVWMLGDRSLIPARFLKHRTVVFGSLFLFFDNMSNYIKLYYLPFYFQAVLRASATRSGVNYIALAAPQFFGLLFSGALITRIGFYMPVILAGQVMCVIGTALLTTIDSHTSTAQWAAYLAITGLGLGLGINAPHIAIQAVMKTDADIFEANGIATFFSQLGGTIAVPIANALLVNGLNAYVPRYAPNVSSRDVITAGPLALTELSDDPEVVSQLRTAYSSAIRHIMIFALSIICASVLAAAGMQWLNLKDVAKRRREDATDEAPQIIVTEELKTDGLRKEHK